MATRRKAVSAHPPTMSEGGLDGHGTNHQLVPSNGGRLLLLSIHRAKNSWKIPAYPRPREVQRDLADRIVPDSCQRDRGGTRLARTFRCRS